MSNINKLQNAIYDNIDSLRDLYSQAEGLNGLINQVGDVELKKKLNDTYDKVIETLDGHIDKTSELIKALKRALND